MAFITNKNGGGIASDYNGLDNQPSINGFLLRGNKTNEQLGIPTVKLNDVSQQNFNFIGDEIRVSKLESGGKILKLGGCVNYEDFNNELFITKRNGLYLIRSKGGAIDGKAVSPAFSLSNNALFSTGNIITIEYKIRCVTKNIQSIRAYVIHGTNANNNTGQKIEVPLGIVGVKESDNIVCYSKRTTLEKEVSNFIQIIPCINPPTQQDTIEFYLYDVIIKNETTNVSYKLEDINYFYTTTPEYCVNTDKFPTDFVTSEYLNEKLTQNIKKWCVFGDSITEKNFRANKNYHDYIAENLAITVQNLGRSGTGYTTNINSGNTLDWLQRVDSIQSDVDVITFFGSPNDYQNLPLGTIYDKDDTTYCGRVNKVIEKTLNKFWDKKIAIITPIPRSIWYGEAEKKEYERAPQANLYGMSKALKEIAELHSLPCLDLYKTSNLYPWISSHNEKYFKSDGVGSEAYPNPDGLHPNSLGHKIIATKIEAFLKSL